MADKKREQGWESQERIDSEMSANVSNDRIDTEIAADISKDRNMLDYVAYNNNGKAFVTLAGIMKVANEVGLTVGEIKTEEVSNLIRTIVEVRTPKDENGEYQSAWSGRDEFKNGGNGVDQYALTKSINSAIKLACKTLLYGNPEIKQLLEDFEATHTFVVTPEMQERMPVLNQQEGDNGGKTAKDEKTANGGKTANGEASAEYASLSIREKARHWYHKRLKHLNKINVHKTDANTTYQNCIACLFNCRPNNLTDVMLRRMIDELHKGDLGEIGDFYRVIPENFDKFLVAWEKEQTEKEAKATAESKATAETAETAEATQTTEPQQTMDTV